MTFRFLPRLQPSLLPHILLAAVAVLASASASAALPIQHWVQPSGASIYLIETHVLPMVDVQVDFDAGDRRDPRTQAGLSSATASQTAKGLLPADPGRGSAEPYAAAMDENALSEAWADLGAGFGGGSGSDRMSFTLRTLSDPPLLARAVTLAARQMGEPAYPAAVWQRDRERAVAAIREANTRPGTVAGKTFRPLVYGTHPYGFEVKEETLRAIDVQDLRSFHRSHLQACRAKVSIVGDVTRAQADAIASGMLARLPRPADGRCEPLPPVAEVEPLQAPVVRAIPFASAQAHVVIGQPGYKRADPDYFPLLVGNYILGGGGFVSRLTQEVREKRGLSYSVYSAFAPGLHAGAFVIGLQTRPDQAAQAVQVARDTLERFVAEGPTAAELRGAKDNLVGGFALRIDSNRELLANLAGIAWNDLPLDYLDTWTKQVEAVTVEQIRAAFARKLQPQKLVVVTVGAAEPSSAAAPTTAPQAR